MLPSLVDVDTFAVAVEVAAKVPGGRFEAVVAGIEASLAAGRSSGGSISW